MHWNLDQGVDMREPVLAVAIGTLHFAFFDAPHS
jgi:hypothetical protein